ncbi:hypothetical protein Desca_1548 [Desulfotomaculum nigrificans CO-1-SRB]|uniref:Uncharacterized protein n=1 Tax=Desulfotomaculum nigrificans (strain DSM 14880 / VKM B-2319 / CO-1-SRB) TaxID=868595 RepID=F6B6M9_DESCC|nr:hypothetical protein [Desulfotomaculum nigrificans]AEF94403.1 hypothetical protein Desca_1548 [Desulfotomaculum nigrificans CO-1-SRB]
MKRFITRQDLLDNLNAEIMKQFISLILERIDECQTNAQFNPNLDKLGHDVLKAAFEFGLVNINAGCPGCNGGGCHGNSPSKETENKPSSKGSNNGKVIPFKRLK